MLDILSILYKLFSEHIFLFSYKHVNPEMFQTHPYFFTSGPLDVGPRCRVSILRNSHVMCHYFCNVHVNYEMVLCH